MMIAKVILVCFAVKEEAAFFQKTSAARSGVRVLLTGIGRRNAERSIRTALEQDRPKLVVSSGFAGGLRPGLKSGAIVYATDPDTEIERALASEGAQSVRFHCAERVAAAAAEKRALWQETGADAVEMESDVIRALCREKGIPTATVRVILDAVEEDLPLDFDQLMTSDQRLSGRKMALALVKSPVKIPALLQLRKQSRDAAKRLAEALTKLLLD
jgi:adenosylhomocysteine nucleosidase